MSKEKIISQKEFEVYYKTQINQLRARLGETVGKILLSKSNGIVKINIVDSGTCIQYVNEKIKRDGFIDYEESICLNIGFEEMLYMYENCNFNLFDGFNKLVTHEFLHVLFGDFNNTKLTRVYNYYIGSISEDKLDNDPYYEFDASKLYDRTGYKKIDHEAYNMAADFVINREIDIRRPFLRAEDFNLDPDLNVFQYYSIIMKNEELRKDIAGYIIKNGEIVLSDELQEAIDKYESESNSGNLTSSNFGNFVVENLDGEDTGMENVPISDEKMMQITDEELLDDLFMGKGRGLGPGNIEFVIKSLKKKESIFFEYTKKVINEIKDDLFNNQDQGLSKIDSWFKYNNRKDDYDFITPGKIKEKDPESKNTEKRTTPIIFIDCSASMFDILKELFYFCYNLLSYISCTVVFYNTGIIKVVGSANSLNLDLSMFGAGGGTNFKDTLEEYKEKYNSNINNVYVFTDGYDNFDNIDIEYLTVYDFGKRGIFRHGGDRL